MGTAADFDGFNLELYEFEDAGFPEVAPWSAGARAEFVGAQARAIRGLATARHELGGIVLSNLVADLTIAQAAHTSRLAAYAATAKAEYIPLADLIAAATLPASDAGYNITPKIVPAPRT